MNDLTLLLEYTRSLSLLYVEDDQRLRESTAELFGNYFKSVDCAANGVEGLAKYLAYEVSNGAPYDLIITDIKMPQMNGLEMCQRIMKEQPLQQVIITTAHNEIDYLHQAIEIGISGFVTKPINNEQLSKVLYRTARTISDHKYVESHVGQIEELNLLLEEQNRELQQKNAELERSLRVLDTLTHKEQLAQATQLPQHAETDGLQLVQQIHEQLRHLIDDDLYELSEVLTEIDVEIIAMIGNLGSIGPNELKPLNTLFSKYANILSYYTFFTDLSSAMQRFATTITEHPLPSDDTRVTNIFMLLESFIYVLGRWHRDLQSGDEKKINAFDASIISDMHTIINMWTGMEDENTLESTVELFLH